MKKPPKRPRYSGQRNGDTLQPTPEEGHPSESPLYGQIKRGLKVFPRYIYKGLRERLETGGIEPMRVLSLSGYTAGNSTVVLRGDGTFGTIPASVAGLVPATAASPVTTTNSPGVVTSKYALEDHVHVGINSFGVSTGGNTAGDTTVRPGRVVLVGSNLTMSVGTDATGQTITVSGPAAATPTGFGVSSGGQTEGNTGTKTGTLVLVGTDLITLSQATDANGATVTIKGTAAGGAISVVSKIGVSTGGHTTGDTGTTYGQIVFAGTNLTLSQATAAGSLATITISGPGSATTVRDIGAAPSVGTVSTRWAPEDHIHKGVYEGGVNTFGNTAGTTGYAPGRLVLVGTSNITLSQSSDTSGATVSFIGASGGGGAAQSRSVYWNIDGENLAPSMSITGASLTKRPILFPLWVDGQIDGCKTIEYWASRAAGTSLNMTHGFALYTMVNSTSLALYSSTTEAISLTTSAQYSGARIYQITGLSNLTLTAGPWIGALYFSGSNNSTVVANLQLYGCASITSMAGYVFAGTNSTGATNSQSQVIPFWGVYSNTTAAWPANINRTEIAGNGTNARNVDPLIIIRNV